MKNTILTAILSVFATFFICVVLNAQTIRRCNNNLGVSGLNVYTTVQAAHNAASDGDIIYIEPSTLDYGGLICTKRLTIIGNGYLQTLNPNTPFDARISKISGIEFNIGSASSTITGLFITGGGVSFKDSAITATRNYIQGTVRFGSDTKYNELDQAIAVSYGNRTVVTRNLILGGDIVGANSGTIGVFSNISNNIINRNTDGGLYLNIFKGLSACVISNNTLRPYDGQALFSDVKNSTITNNILDVSDGSTTILDGGCTGNTVSNNITNVANGLPVGNGNVNGANNALFFTVSNPWPAFTDSPFQLPVTSPAKAIGTGATDAGAFGGTSPYVLSAVAAYPVITNFITSGAGNSNVPLQVSITVRSNN